MDDTAFDTPSSPSFSSAESFSGDHSITSSLDNKTRGRKTPSRVASERPPITQGGLLSAHEARIAFDVARAALPAFGSLPGADERCIVGLSKWLSEVPPTVRTSYIAGLWALEGSAVLSHGRPFSRLSPAIQTDFLEKRQQSKSYVERTLLQALVTPLKWLHFDAAEMSAHVGCRYELPTVRDEKPRWQSQVMNGREATEDMELECEVVVVGTGAGGAAAAYELASRGRAVLMLEEGDYHARSKFRGRFADAAGTLYRDNAMTIALGNVGIPVWAGRAVGGSTVINSGTCYRAPARIFERWQREFGLPEGLSEKGLSPYYEKVEQMLGVAPADPQYTGRIASIIARGSNALGYSHGVLHRNAAGCDGQGVCCFGCPTGAKRSTDVSYVPQALLRGAQLITAAKVQKVDIEKGRARGVTATLHGKDGPKKLRVKADVVLVAGGTLMTPLLLKRSGACKTSRMLGKNLSIHPASKVLALFDEAVRQWDGIPQSYQIEQFADEGLLFEGASVPYDLAATAVPWIGPRFMEIMERFPNLATFGFMIEDTSRGEVREGPGGSPLMLYSLNAHDTARMQKGIEILTEVFQAAGARRVFPFAAGHDDVSTKGALERLKKSRLKPGDFDVTAFHPLGTCRVGTDPRASCINPEHEAHDVGGLYVADGSAVPSALGRNPQMTIMAMALRAAEIIDSRLA
ncbi:MAG: GMC family oxidoreductase [Polyangiaceae bacterium]|nr:GMC family oxidoreductase [Polyangiaceae bacterium]